MAVAERKMQDTETRLSTMDMPAGGWSSAARQAAVSWVRSQGLPSRRDEYWKYTRPDAFVTVVAQDVAPEVHGESDVFDGLDTLKIVFTDGVFDAQASDELALEGVTIECLEATSSLDIHWAKPIYGQLEAAGQVPVARPLAALNTAFAPSGVLIAVETTPRKPVSILYRHQDTGSDVLLHHVVKVAEDASFELLESGAAGARFNHVLEVYIADRGQFHHVRSQGPEQFSQAMTHIFTKLGTQSVFKSFTLSANGQLIRNDCVIELTGDDAVAHIAGAAIGDGDFHHDDTVFITHDALRCESRQVFKKVLRNGAVGVFQGKILVKEGAQKTDGYQISQSLLLDGDSQFLAKPELEIYADDVVCSHGSTSGAIDEEGLFYLRARGVPVDIATDLLTLAFLAEALQEIESVNLSEAVGDRLEAWLARRRS